MPPMPGAAGDGVPVPPSASDQSGERDGSHRAFVGEVTEDDEDGFDSEDFRRWMRDRRSSRMRRSRRYDDDDEDESRDGEEQRTSSGPPPEWDGEAISFQDYAIKARLWLATTKSKPRTRGPLLLQKLSKVPFETMKHLAKDSAWMKSDTNGEQLINLMDQPENFGDDSEEDLLSALAKVTYHLRRGKEETHRSFFNKWEQAMRKVTEHRVVLPEKYVGFLLINALNLGEGEIKSLLNYTRGSIVPSDIREWVRKHETKLQVSQVGVDKDKKSTSTSRTSMVNYVNTEPYDQSDEDEIYAVEAALRDLQDGDLEEEPPTNDEPGIIEEHEAAEILNTFLQKRKSYTQTLKAKKTKELARGYGNGRDKGYKISFTGPGRPPFKQGQYKMSIEELKKVTKCGICHQVGHWHRECPNPDPKKPKEAHTLETEEAIFCGHLDLDDGGQGHCSEQEVLSAEASETKASHGPVFEFSKEVSNRETSTRSLDQPASSADRAYTASFHDYHEILFGEGLRKPVSASYPNRNLDQVNDDMCATVDTGCQRMAIGRRTLERLSEHAPSEIPVQTHEQEHRFKSVHGSSSTHYVASIPTSIGDKGSFLKPAVFDNDESVNAPFLISLPFLLACRTVLHLDPNTGLKAEFKKLGFSVDCHLGPTGALRIPLCNFTRKQRKNLKQMQDSLNRKEFEVLRVTNQDKVSKSTCPVDLPQPHHSKSSHGAQHQASERAANIPCSSDVALPDSQADVGHQGHGITGSSTTSTSCPTARTSSSSARPSSSPTARTGMARSEPNFDCGQQPSKQCRREDEYGILGNGHKCDINGAQGTTCHHTRDPPDDGSSTTLPTSTTSQAVCQSDRTELQSPLLAMLPSSTMQVLHVDGQAAVDPSRHDGVQGVPEAEVRQCCLVQSARDAADTSSPSTTHVQAPQCDQERHECLQDHGEVHRLRSDSHREEDQAWKGKGERKTGTSRPKDEEGNGISNNSDTNLGPQDQGVWSPGDRRSLDGPERGPMNMNQEEKSGSLNRRQKRTLRQAQAALSESAETLTDVITCLTSQNATPEGVFEHLACTLSSGPDKSWGPRKIRRLANTLGVSKPHAKIVAEVFNPERFTPKATKYSLNPGESFDIMLGHDMLKEKVRRQVRQYLNRTKPGLVCVSPPCTLHTIMQNMNQAYRDKHPEKQEEFMRRLCQSTVLLHFAMEICEIVRGYGGTFVFEHPRTSKAWQDPMVNQLQDQDDVERVNNDQCMFGLRSGEGVPHKKPTSWLTNNPHVAKILDKQCDKSHEHQQTLGNYGGISRSSKAARYPSKLVCAILKAYAESLKEHIVHHYTVEDLMDDCHEIDYIWNEVEKPYDFEPMATEILANEEIQDKPDSQEPDMELEENEDDKHHPLPLEKPLSLESLVRRAHTGMGHVSNERLAGILKKANASPEAIKIAKKLHCSTCEHHKRVDSARRAAPPRNYKPNQVVGVDTVWLPGIEPNGKKKMALNCICWATRFQLMIPVSGHTPTDSAKAFYQWIRIFGPPERIYCDLGREFLKQFQIMADLNDIYLDPGALEAPTQRSITERSGRTFKEVLAKTIMETGVTTWEEWHEAVAVVTATINRLSNKSGFSPAQRMLGFNPRLPGNMLSGGYEDYGVLSKLENGDLQVQRAMNLRKNAAIAYHEADCNQALRHAVHSAPKKIYDYQPGQLVYFWRKAQERAKKDNSAFWHGPAKVILTDLPTTVWITYQNKLVRACPEHLRPASEEEKFAITDFIADIVETKKALKDDKIRDYIILDEKPPEADEEKNIRLPLEDPPEDEDDPDPAKTNEPRFAPIEPKYRLRGKHLMDEIIPRDEDSNKKMKVTSDTSRPSSVQAEQGDDDFIYSPSVANTEDLPPVIEISDEEKQQQEPQEEGGLRGTVRPNSEDPEGEQPPTKRIRTEFIEILLTQVLTMSQKKRKEIQMNQVSEINKEKFKKAMQKEIDTNMKSGAYEILGRSDSEDIRRNKPEKILKSRYVFTEKPLENHDVDKAKKEGILLEDADLPGPHKAKARHVMKGFSEVGAEDLDSTTPQVAKESAFFVLQIICSLKWTLGHLDFTQAFHSGDRIARELYAELPPEGVPGVHKRQLLRLHKTCYGLTDGPYAWYQHVSRILEELGYQKSRADPCLFYLFDKNSEIEGIIGLATDDMIHGGNDRHWKNMNWLRQSYQMGKFTTGSGMFTGKQIEVNNDGSMTIHQKNYIDNNIKPIQIDKQRKSLKYNRCNEKEIGDLRGLIGGLSWVSKECRPDIAGRVALLQQTMPHPMIKDMIEGNSILEDLKKTPDMGIKIQPIQLENLRVGVVTDASWGNAGPNIQELSKVDTWEETDEAWIRHHRQERRLSFHPGATSDGPDLHSISRNRITIINGKQVVDQWDGNEDIQDLDQVWTGRSIFMKTEDKKETGRPMSERFLQLCKQSSQGAYILFYYDKNIEISDKPEMISIAGWKSYKLKRCTVNTLSAECQSLLEGIGNLHWHRLLIAEAYGKKLTLQDWEHQLGEWPFIAVTDSKSLYDTVTKCRNSSAHISDKRTAIDLTILKSDLAKTKGQVRWVGGTNMISDALTKKMSPTFLRQIMKVGKWTLTEKGHNELCAQQPT